MLCAYLKGQSKADVCVFKGTEYRQMCAYLKGQSKADVCVFGGTE